MPPVRAGIRGIGVEDAVVASAADKRDAVERQAVDVLLRLAHIPCLVIRGGQGPLAIAQPRPVRDQAIAVVAGRGRRIDRRRTGRVVQRVAVRAAVVDFCRYVVGVQAGASAEPVTGVAAVVDAGRVVVVAAARAAAQAAATWTAVVGRRRIAAGVGTGSAAEAAPRIAAHGDCGRVGAGPERPARHDARHPARRVRRHRRPLQQRQIDPAVDAAALLPYGEPIAGIDNEHFRNEVGLVPVSVPAPQL